LEEEGERGEERRKKISFWSLDSGFWRVSGGKQKARGKRI
jgi:hypothetical protein